MSMMEKAMYLKGLCDGLEPDKTTKEGKLITALLDMVLAMAEEIDDLQEQIDELEDYCDELDSDLGDVEEVLLDLDDDCFDCDDDEYFEIVCPACGDVINFDSSIDPENLRCPNCGEKFECIVEEDDLKALDGLESEE